MRRLTRRQVLSRTGLGTLGFAFAACGGHASGADDTYSSPAGDPPTSKAGASPPATATAIEAPSPPQEPPFVVPAGADVRSLMPGTAFETPAYVYGSGNAGKVVLVLGGVHGNEPAGWLAAERVFDTIRPDRGALLVVPRANKVADSLFERTDDRLGDLNRSYPGIADGLPMERMAVALCDLIRDLHVDFVLDMHESWSFFKDRSVNGTAYLGQTVSVNPTEPGLSLVRTIVDQVNEKVLYPHEVFSLREFPPNGQPGQSAGEANLPRQEDTPPPGRGTSSLGLNRYFPGLIPILVEMGQQQALERRVSLHVDVLTELLHQVGVLDS